jgi:hypothetical protein
MQNYINGTLQDGLPLLKFSAKNMSIFAWSGFIYALRELTTCDLTCFTKESLRRRHTGTNSQILNTFGPVD